MSFGYDPFMDLGDVGDFTSFFDVDPFSNDPFFRGGEFGYGRWPRAVPSRARVQRRGELAAPRRRATPTTETQFDVDYQPDVDAVDLDDKFIVSIECPGMKRESINLDCRDNDLIIRGERAQDEELRKSDHVRLRERNTGRWRRRIRLPTDCDPSQIQANYTNGLLEVVIPKAPAAPQVKRITIQ